MGANYGAVTILIFVAGCIKLRKFASSLSNKLFVWSVFVYSSGFILWLIEKEFCSAVGFLKFHSIWHICAGYGTYFMIFATMVCRANYKRHLSKMRIVKLCNTVP